MVIIPGWFPPLSRRPFCPAFSHVLSGMWFYATGGTSHGPVDFEQLIASLQRTADPPAAHVWRDGMLAWQTAGTLPELAARLVPPLARTPPPPVPQAAAPMSDADAAVGPDGETPVAVIVAVATLYRRLVLLVGAQMAMGIALQMFVPAGPPIVSALLGLPVLAAAFAVSIVMAVTVYRLMPLLDEGVPWLWALAIFVPIVSLVTLLVVSQKSQAWCRQRSIYVGLLGPAKASIDWVRRG